MIWAIISWLLIGALVGLIARAIMPGKQSMGFFATALLGVLGAVVGGFLGGLLGSGSVESLLQNPWSLWTVLLSVIGAVIVLAIYGFATKNRA